MFRNSFNNYQLINMFSTAPVQLHDQFSFLPFFKNSVLISSFELQQSVD